MRNYLIIVGKGFNKHVVCVRQRVTNNKCLCITRENGHVEVCINFCDDDSIRHMIHALEGMLDD